MQILENRSYSIVSASVQYSAGNTVFKALQLVKIEFRQMPKM